MITKKIAAMAMFGLLGLTSNSFAETTAATTNTDFKPISGVRVSMQRMLKSSEGRYFLSLYAGIHNPHAELYDLMDGWQVKLNGTQKGDQLNLNTSSDSDTTQNKYQLSGTLNANTGVLKALVTKNGDTLGKSVQFDPAFKVVNKPVFIFKFYGQNDSSSPYGKVLKRIDVINKNNNTVVQSLTGFSGYPSSVGYMDINFDGYYDVLVSDISNGRTVEDKRYIYWMYNPKTQQFQRSPQMEKIIGLPNLHGEKQQIDFGNGQIYQVENGLLNKLTQE